MIKQKSYLSTLLGVLLLFGLYLTSLYSYLLFHSIAEIFSIVVAFGIFMLAWNSRGFLNNTYLLFIAIAYLFTGTLDLIHTLAYKGMGVFQGYDADLPTQLWIAGRYVESLSLLIAPFLLGRKLRPGFILLGYILAISILLGSILYWNVFPRCFVEGIGLTPFKKISEYLISLILLASIAMLVRRRGEFDVGVLRLLIASIALTIASELAFTFYSHVYGLSNLIGHYLKILSFYFIYRAIVETGLARPYALLLRNLKQSEEALQKAHDELERRIEERTAELAAAVDKLREAELRYRTVADFTYNWEYWANMDGTLRYVSPSCERISGYRAQEFIDNPSLFREIIVGEDKDAWDRHYRDSRRDLKPREAQFRIRKQNGEIRWIEHACQPVLGDQGEFLGIRASNRDITTRKKTEEELRLKDSAIASSINAIGITDLEGKVRYVNDSLVKMWGYNSADEIVGRPLPEFWEGEGVLKTIEVLREKGARIGEDIGKKRDGSLFNVHFSATMIKDEAGNPLYMFGSFLDITERRRAEEDARRHREELAHVTRVATMGELTASLAHELNQPLAAILSNAQAAQRFIARERPDFAEVRDILKDIVQEDKRADGVIQRLLRLLKKGVPERSRLDINDVVQEVMTLVQREAVQKKISMRLDLAPGLPPVLGDRIQLQQVLLNLVLNGFEAMSHERDGSRELVVQTSRDESDTVTVSIRDNGIGIDGENKDRVFDTFFTTKPQGLGMGLSISRSIIVAHGGRLWVTSNHDRGSTFYFTLPATHLPRTRTRYDGED